MTQEALTNCVRHASATHISIRVSGDPHKLEVTVTDDGVGLGPERRRAGLGLRGIEERVRDLHGAVSIDSVEGKGTTLRIKLPLERQIPSGEVALASVAG